MVLTGDDLQVMQTASKLGVSVTVSQVGSVTPTSGTPTVSPIDRTKEWLPAFTLDEEGLLQQLRSNLVQALDASMRKFISDLDIRSTLAIFFW